MLARIFKIAMDKKIVQQSFYTALVVGTILISINYLDMILAGVLRSEHYIKMGLTLIVPYMVSTFASVLTVMRQSKGEKQYRDLEAKLRLLNEFPKQNPNPVLRIAENGKVLFANPSGEKILSNLNLKVGGKIKDNLLTQLVSAMENPKGSVEVQSGRKIFELHPTKLSGFDFINVYGTDITANKVIHKFPDQNPAPVLRISEDGKLLYGNSASEAITSALKIKKGDSLPNETFKAIKNCLDKSNCDEIEIPAQNRIFKLDPVSVHEFEFINVYATDVTAMKTITKFPGQNPNPVLRVSKEGKFLYANDASDLIVKAFGIEVGENLMGDYREKILAFKDNHQGGTIEVESEGRTFLVLVIPVFEFGFINLYGTDITATRELEVAYEENERLLLNILPKSIADRLKKGETSIADHFENITILFADIVGFTETSSNFKPDEMVAKLNHVFCIFDNLVDHYGLEKIKTIGDAYMVVGGLNEGSNNHVEQMAYMALCMLNDTKCLADSWPNGFQIRIGMHTGPAVAGIIGVKKFIYDVWGDTVNIASRMESHGVPNRVQISEESFKLISDKFNCEPRGKIKIKGKGEMNIFLPL